MVNSTQVLDDVFFDELDEAIGTETPLRGRSDAFERSSRERFHTQRRFARGKSGWDRGGTHRRTGKKSRV